MNFFDHELQVHTLELAALWCGVTVVAFVVGRVAPEERGSIRRIVLPAIFATVTAALALFAPARVFGETLVSAAGHATWLLVGLTAINAAALVLFKVVTPRLTTVTKLVQELTVGLAYVVLLFFFLRRFGVNFSSLLATSAVLTAVVAISMQATLGNAFGGLMLQLDQSVRQGDWVRLDDGSEGLVRAVRWRHTVIETRNWDTVVVPNSLLMGQKFLLLGKREGEPLQHRMWVNFNVDFRFAPAEVIQIVEEALHAAPIPNVADRPPPSCVCMDFIQPESSIRYAVRYHLTDLAVDDPTSSVVRTRIYAALRRAKIPLAVTAATVFLEKKDQKAHTRSEERRLQRRLEAVNRLALCAPLTDDERESVAARLKFVPFAAGEIISREGAAAHWLYILDRGQVEIRIDQDGRELPVGRLRAPDFFGEHGMLTGAPRTATVVAQTEVECFRLDRATFHELLKSRPEIADGVASVLATRQEELSRSRERLDRPDQRLSKEDRHGQILSRMKFFFGLQDGS